MYTVTQYEQAKQELASSQYWVAAVQFSWETQLGVGGRVGAPVGEIDGDMLGSEVVGETDGDIVGSAVVGEVVKDDAMQLKKAAPAMYADSAQKQP